MNNLISVIVPVYNVERYVRQCVESLLGQTHKNIEIILINDGSSDKSGVICNELVTTDSRIRVIHQVNRGVSRARNVGVKNARGKYITFVDADDYIETDMLETLHYSLTSTNSHIATCGVSQFYDHAAPVRPAGTGQEVTVLTGEQGIEQMLYQKTIINGVVAKLFTASHFKGVTFNEDMAFAEDLDVNYRVFSKVTRVAVVPGSKYNYLQRHDSAIRSQFSPKRMQGLGVIRHIQGQVAGHDILNKAAANRVFAEATFIALDMPARFADHRNECLLAIKETAKVVAGDTASRRQFRMCAKVATVSPPLLIASLKLVKTARRTLRTSKGKKD
jgi:glycosyltransferase involved in cell wall biosynthesis